MNLIDKAGGKGVVLQLLYIVRDDDFVHIAIVKGRGSDVGDTVWNYQLLLIVSVVIQGIFECLFTDALKPLVEGDVVCAVIVECFVVDDSYLRPYGEALGHIADFVEIRKQPRVVTGVQISVLHDEYRVILVDGHVSERDIAIECTVSDMHQCSRDMQFLEVVVCESMVSKPCEGFRKFDFFSAERQGVVADLFQGLGQHKLLECFVTEHI